MDRNEIAAFVGKRIKNERQNKKLSQEALALKAEIHPSYFGCIERGEKCPTIDTLYKISKALGIELSDLLTETEADTPARIKAQNRINAAVNRIPDDKIDDAARLIEALARIIE